MSDFLRKIQKAWCQPGQILPYLYRVMARGLFLSKRRCDGKNYYVYRGEWYPDYLANHAAASFIINKAQSFCRGAGLDIGAGRCPFPGAVPVEDEKDQNAFCLNRMADGSLDYVFSSHCLEHLQDWPAALCLWISKLRPGGVLFLYLPHESMALWRPGGLWAGGDHKWSPTVEILIPWLREAGLEIIEYEKGRDDYWSFYIAARKVSC